jgi:hypothetical protein
MVTWIVQTNVEPESTSPGLLRRACEELDLAFVAVAITPGAPSLPELPDVAPPAVFHGRNTLIRCALEHPTWRKGVFFSPESFHHDAYVAGFGADLLNASARTLSFDELLSADYAPGTALFVRPYDDSKRFTGQTLRFSRTKELYDALGGAARDVGALSVVVAEVREIDAEWRLFFVGSRVVSGSMYRPSAERSVPKELVEFAEAAASRWTPAPVFVMDVARVEHSWKIVECNCFNGSRFYESDVVSIVRAVSRFQELTW